MPDDKYKGHSGGGLAWNLCGGRAESSTSSSPPARPSCSLLSGGDAGGAEVAENDKSQDYIVGSMDGGTSTCRSTKKDPTTNNVTR